MMECGLISAPQSAFCCIRGLYNDTMLALLLALRVGAMCGTTIMASIGLSFLFLRAFPTFSNVTTACHSASATPSSRLVPPNKKSPPESSRNTTTPRSILCTRFSFNPTVLRAHKHGGGGDVETRHGASLQPQISTRILLIFNILYPPPEQQKKSHISPKILPKSYVYKINNHPKNVRL